MRTRSVFIPALILLIATAFGCDDEKRKKDQSPCEGCCVGAAGELYTTGILNPNDGYQQSDLAVGDLTVGYGSDEGGTLYKMHALVTNKLSDDCSKCSRITVLLPIESEIRSFSAMTNKGVQLKWTQCKQTPPNNQTTAGMVNVEVPDYICQTGDDITAIAISCTAYCAVGPDNQFATSFAVFAGSSVPDPDLSNNYKYWNRAEHDGTGASPTPTP